ncbi:hypothetical protein LSTR_LSTR008507 [Laodelphax striatellus]|uniref:PX domain-containing protein n=1 Tax=Laodelphax striatellus TaxID=195883 RepID=A0A482WQS8_LAOST|nr:hypothetical protein LSTR_LSTR008507 [Laodelphax striatellus]
MQLPTIREATESLMNELERGNYSSRILHVNKQVNSETNAYIQNCITNARKECEKRSPTNTDNKKRDSHNMVKFDVVSSRIIDKDVDRKHVAYTIVVTNDSNEPDRNPCVIERRYTDFLELYSQLRHTFPNHFSSFIFPRKLFIGNFSPDSITTRRLAFESLLNLIVKQQVLKESSYFISFLQNRELLEAKEWIQSSRFDQAIPLVENSFRLLNKLHTDRHPAVLSCLCLLVACCDAYNHNCATSFAELALHRYEAVSDVDLLQFYVPLLNLCLQRYEDTARERAYVEERLASMKRRGINVAGHPTLLNIVMTGMFGSTSTSLQ